MEHMPIHISEDLATVTCGRCGEKLDPIQVLIAYARKESRIRQRFADLSQQIEKAKFKAMSQNRVRCEHCSKFTRIRKADAP